MKRIFILFAVLFVAGSVTGQIHLTTADYIQLKADVPDSAGQGYYTVDSVQIMVWRNGVVADSSWYNTADAQCAATDNGLIFFDAFGDIDGDAGTGLYLVEARGYNNTYALYGTPRTIQVYLGVNMGQIASLSDTLNALIDTVQNKESWLLAGRSKIGDTIARNASTLIASDNIGINLADVSGTWNASHFGTNTFVASQFATTWWGTLKDSVGHAAWTATSTRTVTGLENNAITAASFGTGSISATAIAAATITADKIATNAITADKIAADAIGSSEIADNAIDAGAIGAEAITADKIAANAITALQIADNAITAAKIAADAIGSSELATTAANEIAASAADAVWDELTTGHATAGSFAKLLIDSIDAKVSSAGGTATVGAADMAAISDSVWQKAARTITGGSIDFSDADMAAIGDTVWGKAARTVTGTGANAITATSIADNAITAAKIATDAITADKIAAAAIGVSEWDATAEIWSYDTSSITTGIGQMLKDTSSYQGAASGLSVGDIYDQVATVFFDSVATIDDFWEYDTSSIAAGVGQMLKDTTSYQAKSTDAPTASEIADAVWNEDTTGHYNIGTYGYEATSAGFSPWNSTQRDSILSAVQTISIREKVWDADTASYQDAGTMGRMLSLAGDTLSWASIEDVWRNQDSANVDTSMIGAWLLNNLGMENQDTSGWDATAVGTWFINNCGPGSSFWSTTQRDSVLAALTNTAIGNKVWVHPSTRTLSSYLWTTAQRDSVLSASTATSVGTKAWSFGARTLTSQTWSTTQRDSVLNAITDANKANFKATGFSSHTAADAADAVWDEIMTGHTTAGSAASLIRDSIADAIAEVSVDAATMAAIGDTVLNKVVGGSRPTGSLGGIIVDSIDAQVSTAGSVASVADADMSAIADSVWDKVLGSSRPAGSAGDIIVDSLDAKVSTAGSVANITDADMAAIGDSVLNKTLTGRPTGSLGDVILDSLDKKVSQAGDTLAIKTMAQNNPNTFKASGFSTHSAADVYTYFTAGTNEDQFKANVSALASQSSVTAIRDSLQHLTTASGFSTHDAVDVYNHFITGDNERALWITDSVQGVIAGMAADSIGSITASVDSAQIARYVWNTPQTSHTNSGTFGNYLDMNISSVTGLAGSGAYTKNIYVVDSTGGADTTLANVKVYVNNTAQNASPYQADTDNNGRAVFNLNNGTYVRFIVSPGFAQVVDTFAVTGTGSDTLYTYKSTGGRTTVAFQIKKLNGLPWDSARIELALHSYNRDSLLRAGDTIIVGPANNTLTATASSLGLATVDLFPNSVFTNDSSYYVAIIRDKRRSTLIEKFKFRVPTSDTAVYVQELTRWDYRR